MSACSQEQFHQHIATTRPIGDDTKNIRSLKINDIQQATFLIAIILPLAYHHHYHHHHLLRMSPLYNLLSAAVQFKGSKQTQRLAREILLQGCVFHICSKSAKFGCAWFAAGSDVVFWPLSEKRFLMPVSHDRVSPMKNPPRGGNIMLCKFLSPYANLAYPMTKSPPPLQFRRSRRYTIALREVFAPGL